MSSVNWATADLSKLTKTTINGLNAPAIAAIGARIDDVPQNLKGDLEARQRTFTSSSNADISSSKSLVANDVAKKTAVNVTAIGKVSAVKTDAAKALTGFGDELIVYVAAPAAGGRRTRRRAKRTKRAKRSTRRHR